MTTATMQRTDDVNKVNVHAGLLRERVLSILSREIDFIPNPEFATCARSNAPIVQFTLQISVEYCRWGDHDSDFAGFPFRVATRIVPFIFHSACSASAEAELGILISKSSNE